MANKRDQSKQRRANENRAQRAAREARAKAAAVPFEERVAQKTPAGPSKETPKKGAKGGKERGPRQAPLPRPGMTPVDLDTLEGGWFRKTQQVPGGQQIQMTVLMTLALSVMASVSKLFAEEGAPKKAKPTLTIFESLGAKAWIFLAIPVTIAVVAAWATLKPFRRRVWYICLVLMAVYVAASPIGIFYLFPAGTIAWAMWRAAKVEGPGPGLFGRRRVAVAADDDAGPDADGTPDD